MVSCQMNKPRFLLLSFALLMCCLPAVEAKTVARKHINNKYCLVPPPPPYVPSMLPELRYQAAWRNSAYSNSQIGSAQTYKPNKYLTYVR